MLDDARRAVMDSFYFSACSYVKPGAIHRLSLTGMLDQYIVSGHALLPVAEKAYRRGEEVAQGARGMPDAGLGGMIAEAARTIYAWLGRPAPSLEAAAGAIIISAAMGHVHASGKRPTAGNIRSSAARLVQASSPRDFKEFYEALRIVGQHRAIDMLGEKGLRPSRAEVEGLGLLDAFDVLGKEYPGYGVLNPRTRLFGEVADNIKSRHRETKSLNDALIYAYTRMVEDKFPGELKPRLHEALEKGLMSTGRGARLLLELDREMNRRRISLNHYVPVLTTVLPALILEGLRP